MIRLKKSTMHIIFKWIISALSILFVAYALPKLGLPGITIASFYTALIVALVLGLLNITLKPILVILTLPINLITLGLFTFVINGFLFWFAASFIDGFTTEGFTGAFVGALLVSLISMIGHKVIDSLS